MQAVESADEQLLVPQPKKARRQSLAVLPVSRVRTIMKAKLQPSKTGQQLGKDSVPIITKAAVSSILRSPYSVTLLLLFVAGAIYCSVSSRGREM